MVGSGRVKFTQDTQTNSLSYTFSNLACGTDDVSFSNNSGKSYVYSPVNTGGFDANVTNISIYPKNAFACSTTGSTPKSPTKSCVLAGIGSVTTIAPASAGPPPLLVKDH